MNDEGDSENKSDRNKLRKQTEEENNIIMYNLQYREQHKLYQDQARRILHELEEKARMVIISLKFHKNF